MKNKKDYMIPLVIGVTGHRDILKEDIKPLEKKIEEIFKSLEKKYPITPFILLTPLADGADRIAARVALEKFKDKITIKVPLPFDEETYKGTFGVDTLISNEDSILEYEEIIEQIAKQENVTKSSIEIKMNFKKANYTSGTEELKTNIRHDQYSLVGEYIAIHSHILIALENPKSNGKAGGTSEVVKNKLSGKYKFLGQRNDISQPEQGIVYHINTPRLGLPIERKKYRILKIFPNVDEPDNWIITDWNKNEYESTESCLKNFKEHLFSKPCLTITQKENLNSYRQQHIQIECLNKKIDEDSENIKNKIKKDSDIEFFKNKKETEDSFKLSLLRRAVTTISRKHKSKMESIEKDLLLLLLLSTSIVLTKSLFPEYITHLLNIFYPIIIIIFYVLVTYFKNYKKIHEDARAISEGIRIQIAWNIGKVNESVALNYLSRQKDELTWIRSSLRTLNIFNSNDKSDLTTDDIKEVEKYWIDEQIGYFKKNIKEYKEIENNVNKRIKILLFSFVFFSLFFSLNTYMNYFDIPIIKTLTLSIPLVLLAFLKSKQLFDGHEKTIKQYELSLGSFKRAKELLAREGIDQKDKKEILKNLGQEALFENSFWTILRREKSYKTPSL